MRRRIALVAIAAVIVSQSLFAADQTKRYRIVQPRECRASKYSCVLKKIDGVPFFCVKTTKQRYQNARRSVRSTTKMNCLRRYPVEYEEIDSPNDNPE